MPFLTGNTIPTADFVCRVVRIPNDPFFVMAVSGALLELTKVWNWESFGEMLPDEMAQASITLVNEFLGSNGCMLGAIFPYAGESPPPNCIPCDGGTYNRTDFPRLYSVLDPVFILDADTFTTPDMQNKFPLGADLDHPIGSAGGETNVTLTVDEMPEHTHVDSGHDHFTHGHINIVAVVPGEGPVTAPSPLPESTTTGAANIQPAGAGLAHNNIPPYRALPYCIVAR